MIPRRKFLGAFGALAAARVARAQQRSDLPRIGMLFAAAPPAVAARVVAFREGLAALGYVEGKQIAPLEIRYAYGDLTRLPALATELVRMPVKVIVTGGSSATLPARNATSAIPIVMGQDNDPVGAGVVTSLARPGGNITGLSTLAPELSAKPLALLLEMVPGLQRVAIFGDSEEAGNAQAAAGAERAAVTLNVQSQTFDLRNAGDLAQMFAAAGRARVGAGLVLASAYMFVRQDEVVALALKARLPVIYAHPEFVRRGGLATYGVDVIELFRRSAGYVVKILNGSSPADLPIEQPTKFDFVINLKTAKAIGLSIPRSLLARADEVIQ